MGLNSILLLLLLLSKSASAVSWVKSRVWALLVHNPVNMVTSSGVGLLAPLNFIRLVMLLVSPGVVSLVIRRNVRCAILGWIGLLLLGLLSESWDKSRWAFIADVVNVISSGDISLLAPGDLIAVVMLVLSPGVLSLSVWVDVRVAILDWINHVVSLS